jgi:hypothetical protein
VWSASRKGWLWHITRINFRAKEYVPAEAFVSLEILSVTGRLVRLLAKDVLPAGRYTREWDGRNAAGQSVSGGVYIARLEAKGMVVSHRLILVR